MSCGIVVQLEIVSISLPSSLSISNFKQIRYDFTYARGQLEENAGLLGRSRDMTKGVCVSKSTITCSMEECTEARRGIMIKGRPNKASLFRDHYLRSINKDPTLA